MTPERYETVVDPVDGTRWRVDVAFTDSHWRCRWGDGCRGILDEPAPELEQGCCSVGAELLDDDEAMTVAALASTLTPDVWQHHGRAVFRDDGHGHTNVVDGACVFFNHPPFAGGVGCALHLAALADGDDPMEWKPSVCWQLPVKVDREDPDGPVLRRWRRSDWGPGGETMAWCCTEGDDCLEGDVPVAISLRPEITALVGPDVAALLEARATSTSGQTQSPTDPDRE